MKITGSNGNRFSWYIGSIGIVINLLYFFYESIAYGGGMAKHLIVFPVEHLIIVSLIPLSIVVAVLVEKKSTLQRELEVYSANLEKTVKERTKELEESNRLKDLFSDILTHDLLNPLSSTKNAVEMEMDERPDDEILLIASRSLSRAVELIENAKRYSKLAGGERLELRRRDLAGIIQKAVDDFAPQAKERKLHIEYSPSGKSLAMVNAIIYDVFSNLLSNAIKYGPVDSEVVVGIEESGPNWKISVADSGPGIPDKDKEAVFDRFKRIEKGAVKGTGLGLAIVKKAVELHSGSVWAEDNPKGGSVFYVLLKKA